MEFPWYSKQRQFRADAVAQRKQQGREAWQEQQQQHTAGTTQEYWSECRAETTDRPYMTGEEQQQLLTDGSKKQFNGPLVLRAGMCIIVDTT